MVKLRKSRRTTPSSRMDRYDVKNYLSAGAQAETYIALDKQTSELVILKIASKKCLDERQKE